MATADLLTPQPAAPRRDPAPRLWTDAEFARMQQLGLFAGREVELVGGTVLERATGEPFVFTRREYYALGDNHFFRDQRVQLIGGVILEETAVTTPLNATVVCLAARAIEQVFGRWLRCALPTAYQYGLGVRTGTRCRGRGRFQPRLRHATPAGGAPRYRSG